VAPKKETRFLWFIKGAIAFSPKQRNRVSAVNIKVNCESEKETRFLGFLKEAIAFSPKQRNRVSVVNIFR
jgi:hypothetical protein